MGVETGAGWSAVEWVAYAPTVRDSVASPPAVASVDSWVAVVMAMEVEAAPLRAALDAEPIDPPSWASSLPVRLAVAPAAGSRPNVLLAVNGDDPMSGVASIGTTAAALTTHVALNLEDVPRPGLVLSVGTAGGWSRHGSEVGDTYFAWPYFTCHDRRIDLPGFQAFGDGDLPAADLRSHAEALGCGVGIVTTGDSLDESPTDRERILGNDGVAKEMEAAAVAWVCHLHGVPVGAVKTITDLVDSEVDTPEQFTANLAVAVSSLQRTTLGLLDRLGAPS
jgi:5'-methylthioadenosine nucleosidase